MTDIMAVPANNFLIKGQIGKRGLAVVLQVQKLVVERGAYSYVEIGSFMGRTLYTHLVEKTCRKALSIDLRPDVARDERRDLSVYKGISAEDMIAQLGQYCNKTQLKKLETLTDTSDALRNYDATKRFDMALIDGEHTNTAVFQDFLNLRRVMAEDCVIVFDDTHIVMPGIQNAVSVLRHEGVVHHVAYCVGALTVVGIGKMAEVVREGLDPSICISEQKATRRYRNNIADNLIVNELPRRLQQNKELRGQVEKILAK